MNGPLDIEVCAGPGGWDQGIRPLGYRPIGVEFARDATDTARAAGHLRVLADMTAVDPRALTVATTFAAIRDGARLDAPTGRKGETSGAHRVLTTAGMPTHPRLPVRLLIGSPPRQGFSMAGKGKGREDAERLIAAIALLDDVDAFPSVLDALRTHMADHRSILVLEPLRYAVTLLPLFIALEQVPAVLPIWEAYAHVLRRLGYDVATGVLNAEQYGVPQTRRRAILVARRDGHPAALPTPTHSRFHSRTPKRLDDGVPRWVSMAEALGWGASDLVGFPRRSDGRGEDVHLDGVAYRARDLRPAEYPSFVVTEKARSWTRFPAGLASPADPDDPELRAAVIAEVTPRVNNQSGTPFDYAWPLDRPAPVIAGRGLVTMPGANANRFNGSTKSRNDGIRVTPAEAAVLQSFPATYPWRGVKTSQFQQIGDAVPPLLAHAVIAALTGASAAATTSDAYTRAA